MNKIHKKRIELEISLFRDLYNRDRESFNCNNSYFHCMNYNFHDKLEKIKYIQESITALHCEFLYMFNGDDCNGQGTEYLERLGGLLDTVLYRPILDLLSDIHNEIQKRIA